jgi:pyruvate/2-oxoglutarate/acetoin dehydrogenase E1 component
MKTGNEGLYSKDFGEAILEGFEFILSNDPNSFVIGQGLWSPWYVGNSMTKLDKMFGIERVIDTPVSEAAATGAAVGAAICGKTAIVVHPRMDFALYAMDPIINQAAKWRSMLGGQNFSVNLTVRMIINRGGEQGAQHSQALQSIFAHIPGLRVVMPSSPSDARDMLIACALCKDPVVYIDDRWLYDFREELKPPKWQQLSDFKPIVLSQGTDLTIVASGYSTHLSKQSVKLLKKSGISAELIDLRILSPIDINLIHKSVSKTKKLLVVDGAWAQCGISSEIIAALMERDDAPENVKYKRVTLPFAPAPTSQALEKEYYFDEYTITKFALRLLDN